SISGFILRDGVRSGEIRQEGRFNRGADVSRGTFGYLLRPEMHAHTGKQREHADIVSSVMGLNEAGEEALESLSTWPHSQSSGRGNLLRQRRAVRAGRGPIPVRSAGDYRC